jgi:ferredoxin
VSLLIASFRLRTTAQLALLALAALIVLHGFAGPQLAPRNLATVLTWVHYRGLLIGALLLAGNVFCGACPMILVRDIARRFHQPRRRWPSWLGRKAPGLVLFAIVLYSYELFDFWSWPAATASLVIGYFAAALVVDVTFRGAAFCRHICPVGQFSFIASTLSPTEVRPRDAGTCERCTTADCITGRRSPDDPSTILRRGCELGLFLPAKVGNLDCTFCLDCVRACPHDNVAIAWRAPGEELADDRRRSGLGRLSRRPDLAALALLFTFAALLNAFAMVGPAYDLQRQIALHMGVQSEAAVLALLFAAGLGAGPVLACGGAAWLTRRLTASDASLTQVAIRFAYALTPLGAGMWLAHYAFHFLTALGTVVPVAQIAVTDLTGRALLGEAVWGWMGVRPGAVFPFQIAVVLLGAFGAGMLTRGIAEREYSARAGRGAAAWLALIAILTAIAIWILAQPMEMRGATLGE